MEILIFLCFEKILRIFSEYIEEIITCLSFDIIYGADVIIPLSSCKAFIGHINSYDVRNIILNTIDIIATFIDYESNLPYAFRHPYAFIYAIDICNDFMNKRTICFIATFPIRPRHDIDFISSFNKSSEEFLEIMFVI